MIQSSDGQIRVYAANSSRGGLASSLAVAVRELWSTREIIWRLFMRDFVSQFRQSLFGYLWTFVTPLVGLVSFLFLHYAGILTPGGMEIPYPVYLYVGLTLWGILIGVVTSVSGSLLAHGELLLRSNVPKLSLAVAGLANVIYLQCVQFVLMLVVCAVFGILPSWWIGLYPLVAFPMLALGLGIGLVLAAVGAIVRDISTVVIKLLSLTMYITPVIYLGTLPNPNLQPLLDYNPLTYLVDGPRSLFLFGSMAHPASFAASSALACLILSLGIHGFYLVQDHVAERI